jgi:hypothetical protein
MAQSGYTPISLYYSTVSGRAPSAANLAQGELAINTTDGVLYYKNASGNVVPLTSAGGASAWEPVQTANFTAVAGQSYPINTTSGSITVTLPASPTVGQVVGILDYAGTFGTNALLIANNGSNINGAAVEVIVTTNREALTFGYVDSTQGWIIFQSFLGTVPLPANYNAAYLIVAGAAGGGGANNGYNAGAGGAGGLLTGCASLTPKVTYTITVGGGGPGGGGGNPAYPGTNGVNSSLSGTGFTTLTSIGGGGGANGQGSNGAAGGSGGGGYGSCNGYKTCGGAGTAGQGNNGAQGSSSGTWGTGGGGGGAGGAGSAPTGGAGLTSYIAGAGVIYATGGNGGQSSCGASGGANTGNGAGGGGYGNGAGGTGGSGIVILSVPTARYTGTTTGSPTITINGSNTVMTFNSSGSYTA